MGHQLGSAPGDYSVTRDTINTASGCPSIIQVPVDPNTSDELLDNGMQLNEIAINCSGGRCLVNVHVIFYGGDHDVFATNIAGYGGNPWLAPDAECTGSLLSTQFCAVADYNRTVTQG